MLTRIRRTYKDLLNLLHYIRKEFEILLRAPAKEDPETASAEIYNTLMTLLQMRKLNTKINMLHRFLEISFLSFSPIEEAVMKQLTVSKKSGKKKMKTFMQEVMTCFE